MPAARAAIARTARRARYAKRRARRGRPRRWRGGCGTSRLRGLAVSRSRGGLTSRPRDPETPLPLLEQCVERLARVVRRLRLPRLVGSEVPDHLRLEERALVAI